MRFSSKKVNSFTVRLQVAFAALVCVYVLVFTGCYSHEDRWGRDPAKLKQDAPRQDHRTIEIAKSDIIEEEGAKGEEDELAPVSVLFINGDPITVDDVLKWIRPQLSEMRKQFSYDDYMRQVVEISRAAIRSRAESQLLYQLASRQMTESEKERLDQFVDSRIRDIVNEDYGGRQTRYESSLLKRGLSLADDRERIKREMLVGAHLQRTLGNKVTEPTRRELEQYYREHLQAAKEAVKRRMRLIDIPVGNSDATGAPLDKPVSREDGLAKANEALDLIREGKPFADVAKTHSSGINAYNGGDWGWVTAEGVRPRWARAVEVLYRLKPEEVSDIIETDDGFFIVQCEEVQVPETKSFVEMQTELIAGYKNRQYDLLVRELVAGLYDEAVVRPENPARFLRAVVEAATTPGSSSVSYAN